MLVLREDLYFCLTARGAIFLDLAANRYFALDGAADRAFRRIVAGDRLDPELERDLKPLFARGALYRAESLASFSPPQVDAPTASLAPDTANASLPRVATAVMIHCAIRLEMRVLGLKVMVKRRRNRKLRAQRRATWPAAAVIEILAAHRKIDRLLGAANRCLPRSLALIDHLARSDIYPDLVIGVRTGAFTAHCWVQDKSTVCNDELDRVVLFTPILSL